MNKSNSIFTIWITVSISHIQFSFLLLSSLSHSRWDGEKEEEGQDSLSISVILSSRDSGVELPGLVHISSIPVSSPSRGQGSVDHTCVPCQLTELHSWQRRTASHQLALLISFHFTLPFISPSIPPVQHHRQQCQR